MYKKKKKDGLQNNVRDMRGKSVNECVNANDIERKKN